MPVVDWVHDLAGMAAAARPGDVVAVTNPHNPTGTAVRPDELRAFLRAVPRDCVVLVDEAYHEYMDDEVRVSAIGMLDLHPGLVVSRTFSKVYGLAGLRAGYAIGGAATLEPLDRVRTPANVNAIALAAAAAALDDRDHVERTVALTRRGVAAWSTRGPTRAGARAVADELRARPRPRRMAGGARPRTGSRSGPGANLGVPGWHRVTIGTPAEMDRVIAVLELLFG